MASILTFPKGAALKGQTWQDYFQKAVAGHDAAIPSVVTITDTFWKEARFTLPKGASPQSLVFQDRVRRDVQRWIEKKGKEGWALVSNPIVQKVPVLSDDAPITAQGIRESDPTVPPPDLDLYRVVAQFRRRPVAGTLILPDSMATALPKGMLVR